MKKFLMQMISSKTESVDNYQGVLIPLAQAQRQPSVNPINSPREQVTSEKIDEAPPNTNVSKSDVDIEKADPPRRSLQSSRDEASFTIEELRAEVLAEVKGSENNSGYDLKSIVINKAIQDVGMGRYNWSLFILCGFGWFADNLWLQQVALTLPSLSADFNISENNVRYTTSYLFIGLCLGSTFWGVGSDVMGRRLAFNSTLLIAGACGVCSGAAPSWAGVCALYFAMGFGVGGNLPVDGALFLEFLPNASGHLLTLMSIWWPVGQLIASIGGWVFMGGGFAPDKGWRYSLYTMGGLTLVMFLARFFLFHLYESPKFLLSQGRQSEAVAVIHAVAAKNKTTTWITEDILNSIGGDPEVTPSQTLTASQIIKRKISTFSTKRFGPLFATRQLGINTVLLWFCWLTIGMGYLLFNGFLPQYLSNGQTSSGQKVSSYETYRNYAITSAMGVPGSILACFTVDMRYIGRKGTMATSTIMSSIMIFLFTTSSAASSQLAFSSTLAFFQNIMYGVLYAYTPEVFPAPSRGTGTGISSLLNRIAGLSAPVIAANVPVDDPNIPIYVSGALIMAAFIAMLFLSIETRGRQML